MNKIISPLVLAVLLIWSWNVINTPAAIGFETHSGIQTRLVELIENTLKAKKPDATDLEIVKIWTTALDENKVQANFAYRFSEPEEGGGVVKKTIQGIAILHREPSEDPTLDKWILQSVKSQLESLNFSEGPEVLPEDTTAPVNSEATTPATPDDKPKENESH